MAAIKNNRRFSATLAAVVASTALASAVVAACSSDNNNPAPPNQVYNVEAGTTQPDSASSGSGDDGSTTPSGDDGSAAADVKEEPVPRDAACLIDQPAAQGAASTSACWNCAPGINSDFLNHCAATGVVCVPFDNSRLPGYDGGALPPTQ
jgi:hypothetical protein